MTRRFVALCLALLLPLQFAWSAAAAHCQHETAPAGAVHFGHHAHVHEGAAQPAADGSALSVDTDCAYCHAAVPHAPAAVPAALVVSAAMRLRAGRAAPAPASAPTREPDRPQWPRLA